MSPPTPLTMSIITVLSGSTRSWRPTLKWPDASHVHAVVSSPAAWQPSPKSVHVIAEEGPDRAAEGDEDARRRDPRGRAAGEPHPTEEDEDRRDERRQKAEPGTAGHPRSSDSRSTSSASFLRLIATTRPKPTQTSDAATAITARPKICPAPFAKWRENAMSARFPPFSISSSERRTMSGLRRMSTPSAPIPNRNAASARYQVVPGPLMPQLFSSGRRGSRRRLPR